MVVKFRPSYFFASIILFIVEIYIGVFVNDSFIRPYFGDFLVVIFIYCFLKSFWNESVNRLGLYVLAFSYAVEVSQYFKFIKVLGLQNSTIARLILGSSFAWNDIVAYTLGILFIIIVEGFRTKRRGLGHVRGRFTGSSRTLEVLRDFRFWLLGPQRRST